MRFTLLPWLLCCTLLALPAAALAAANDDVPVVGSTDELFDLLHAQDEAEDGGVSIDTALRDHLAGGEVDEGTYPPSDLWEQQFDPRREDPDELTYSGRTRWRYSRDKISDVTKWEKELELNFKYGDWSSYSRTGDINEFAYVNDPFRWQKFRVNYNGDDFKATVGSFGAVFGRGLAVNMFEDRLLEFDNEAEGVKLEYSFGKTEATFIAGTRKLRSEARSSTIKGVQLHSKIDKHAELGMYYADVMFPEAGGGLVPTSSMPNPVASGASAAAGPPPNINRFSMHGIDATVHSGQLSTYLEVMHLQRGQQPWGNFTWQTDGADGRGVYATASFASNGYSLTGEYKDFFHITQPFGVCPPVRRWEEKATATPDDDKGYNFQLLMTPKNGSSWLITYGQDTPHSGNDRPYTEFITTYTSPSKHGFSYVAEYFHIVELVDHLHHERLTLNKELNDDWSSSAVLQHKRRDTPYIDGHSFILYDLELAYRSVFDVVYTHENTNMVGATPDEWELWEAKYKPDDDQEVHLTYGSRRAGFVCSGGVCRLEPEFDGTKVEYLLRF